MVLSNPKDPPTDEQMFAKPLPLDPQRTLGIHPRDTHMALQTDVFKELVNKLAWVLGSTYQQPYSNTKHAARVYALLVAKAVVRDHGYPGKIAK